MQGKVSILMDRRITRCKLEDLQHCVPIEQIRAIQHHIPIPLTSLCFSEKPEAERGE